MSGCHVGLKDGCDFLLLWRSGFCFTSRETAVLAVVGGCYWPKFVYEIHNPHYFPDYALYLFIASHKLSSDQAEASGGIWATIRFLRQAQGRLSTSLRYARWQNVPYHYGEKYFGMVSFFSFIFSQSGSTILCSTARPGILIFRFLRLAGMCLPGLFGWDVPKVGGLFDRLLISSGLWYTNSPVFNIATALSLITLSSMGIRRKNKTYYSFSAPHSHVSLVFIIGSYRFVVMIIPLFVLIIAYALQHNANNANLMPILPAGRQEQYSPYRYQFVDWDYHFLELLFLCSFLLSRSMGWQVLCET